MLSTGLLHAVLREMADTYRKLLEAKLGIGDCGLWLAESQVMINLYRMGSCPSDCPTVRMLPRCTVYLQGVPKRKPLPTNQKIILHDYNPSIRLDLSIK